MTVLLDDLNNKSDEELIAIKNGKIPFFISAKSTITREDYMSKAESILHKRQLSSIPRQRAVNLGTPIDIVDRTLESYIKTCAEKGILKKAIHKLADSVREFRNLVHLQREESPRYSISTPTAKSAVASVFIIINDFGN
jgi:hypothetical protein